MNVQTNGNGSNGNGSTAIARPNAGPPTEPVAAMKHWISKSAGAFAKILPKHLTPERFLKVAHACITKTPRLAQCEPKDIVMALIQCSEMGLEPNTPLHHVHLIPFKNGERSRQLRRDVYDVQLIIGFEGYLELMYRTGKIRSLSCEVAYEADEFDYDLGSKPFIHHKPNLKIRKLEDRGEIQAAYMCADIDGGGTKITLMSYADVIAIRDRSHGYRNAVRYGKDHPWTTDFGEMAKKTVIRRGQKQMPKGVEFASSARAAQIDAREEYGARKTIDVDVSVLSELPVELGISVDDTRAGEDEQLPAEGEQRVPEISTTTPPQLPAAPPPAVNPQAERLKDQTKTKARADKKQEQKLEAPPAEQKPVDPLDCSKRKEGDVFEVGTSKFVVRPSPMGLVPVLISEAPKAAVQEATADAPPDDDDRGDDPERY